MCISAFLKEQEEKRLHVYITDALQIIAENTSRYAGGKYMTQRYAELIWPQEKETRTAEEVIESIKDKLRKLK